MKDEYLIIKRLENLDDLELLQPKDVVRILRERYTGAETPGVELRVYAGKIKGKQMEFLNATGPWPSPISGWLIENNPEKIGIKEGMIYIPFFALDAEKRLYINKGDPTELYRYNQKRGIIEESELLPHLYEELTPKR